VNNPLTILATLDSSDLPEIRGTFIKLQPGVLTLAGAII
jgi:hypothetical protein